MLYDANGNVINIESTSTAAAVVQRPMHTIAHRGYNPTAPENTIPAFVLAKKMGYEYVECDVAFTSDGVAVLLHDSTIDRTSNGSGSLANMTYEEVLQYDFGSWKSADYAGTKIPTFEEFILVCKELQLHPCIEIKSDTTYTQAQIASVVEMVKAAGMAGRVSYISFSTVYLAYIKAVDAAARLLYAVSDISTATINAANALKTGKNEVGITVRYTAVTDAKATLCMNAGIQLEVWSPNDASWIQNMNPYITGVTSDSLIAEDVLYSKHIAD